MKVVDFIKKFGWDYTVNYADYAININDLKQYVDAYELVESYGGLDSCYEKLHMLHELTENPEPIREAIALVEEVKNET